MRTGTSRPRRSTGSVFHPRRLFSATQVRMRTSPVRSCPSHSLTKSLSQELEQASGQASRIPLTLLQKVLASSSGDPRILSGCPSYQPVKGTPDGFQANLSRSIRHSAVRKGTSPAEPHRRTGRGKLFHPSRCPQFLALPSPQPHRNPARIAMGRPCPGLLPAERQKTGTTRQMALWQGVTRH